MSNRIGKKIASSTNDAEKSSVEDWNYISVSQLVVVSVQSGSKILRPGTTTGKKRGNTRTYIGNNFLNTTPIAQ
jgi:hypothetical protein